MLADMPASAYEQWYWYYGQIGGVPDAVEILLAQLCAMTAVPPKGKPQYKPGDFYPPLREGLVVPNKRLEDYTDEEIDRMADMAFGGFSGYAAQR